LCHKKLKSKADPTASAAPRLGLPTTSAPIESTIKQVSRRVKGTEKFWSVNADPMLQLRADMISETTHMDDFWSQRSEDLSTFTHYKMAG
jgi:hypothetical protein